MMITFIWTIVLVCDSTIIFCLFSTIAVITVQWSILNIGVIGFDSLSIIKMLDELLSYSMSCAIFYFYFQFIELFFDFFQSWNLQKTIFKVYWESKMIPIVFFHFIRSGLISQKSLGFVVDSFFTNSLLSANNFFAHKFQCICITVKSNRFNGLFL